MDGERLTILRDWFGNVCDLRGRGYLPADLASLGSDFLQDLQAVHDNQDRDLPNGKDVTARLLTAFASDYGLE